MLQVRRAVREDVSLILALIRELAEYEREATIRATEDDLIRDGFGQQPRFECLIAEVDGIPAGYAIFFYNYSTWEGRAGIYLEDLYVRPQFRRLGIGRVFFRVLAERAVRENLGKVVWQVLDWNQPAIDFYTLIGARRAQEWQTMWLSREELRQIAAGTQDSDITYLFPGG
jgi:GNAT superfamily N-acetyltransferase